MSDQGELYEMSWILYHVLDRFIGSQEIIAIRRMLTVLKDQLHNLRGTYFGKFSTGSKAEGIDFYWSDTDGMMLDQSVIVICPDQHISNQIYKTDKLVLMMREADSRPGYVHLELLPLGKTISSDILQSIVKVRGAYYISSEILKRGMVDASADKTLMNVESHGPAVHTKSVGRSSKVFELDVALSFPCYNWPSEANEWMNRPRLHNWPDKALRDQIAQGGCHLVPVGDKTSADTFLQWRISFATAERKLIYSLSHVQFLVYGLLKIFLKQISGMLKQLLDEEDVLSSYIIKTVIFYAVENTPASFWDEKHTFLCFMFCLKILINWVYVGCCPNYFIKKNNMFLGKVHVHNRQKLLRFLTDLYNMNWKCLSIGTTIQIYSLTIEEHIRIVRNGEWIYVLPTPTQSERERDFEILGKDLSRGCPVGLLPLFELLLSSRSDADDFLCYFATVHALSHTGMKIFGEHITARGNKEKYKSLRKCKNLLTPLLTVCTSSGLLSLATFYYQTGNYMKTLELCDHVISSFKFYFDWTTAGNFSDRYEQLYCGRGFSLLHKCKAFVSDIYIEKNALHFIPSQLHQEIMALCDNVGIARIPPLPYALLLSFLCYHVLGDTRNRDGALIHLQDVKYDERYYLYLIVHNLLGICYEMLGDKRKAIREYRNALKVSSPFQHINPAQKRIERLQQSQ